MSDKPWWCGYPGCKITGECGDGICVIEEAKVQSDRRKAEPTPLLPKHNPAGSAQ